MASEAEAGEGVTDDEDEVAGDNVTEAEVEEGFRDGEELGEELPQAKVGASTRIPVSVVVVSSDIAAAALSVQAVSLRSCAAAAISSSISLRLGTDGRFSPRHRRSFNSRNKGEHASDDVASTFHQSLPQKTAPDCLPVVYRSAPTPAPAPASDPTPTAFTDSHGARGRVRTIVMVVIASLLAPQLDGLVDAAGRTFNARPRIEKGEAARDQGLTLARFTAQLEDLRDTSLTSELNLRTFGPHPRVTLGCMGDKVSLS